MGAGAALMAVYVCYTAATRYCAAVAPWAHRTTSTGLPEVKPTPGNQHHTQGAEDIWQIVAQHHAARCPCAERLGGLQILLRCTEGIGRLGVVELQVKLLPRAQLAKLLVEIRCTIRGQQTGSDE